MTKSKSEMKRLNSATGKPMDYGLEALHRAQRAEALIEKLEDTLALMAEGEGTNEQVYMTMAGNAFKLIQEWKDGK